MYDTIMAINELWLQQGSALVISKIYASVAAMEADDAPVSDITDQPLRAGQIVVIASSDSDNGSVYRYNGTEEDVSSWSLVGAIGNTPPVDSLDSDSTQYPLAAHQGKVLDGKISELGQEVCDSIVIGERTIDFGFPDEPNGYIYYDDGHLEPSVGYKTSKLIPILSRNFTLNYSLYAANIVSAIAFWDKDKNYLKSISIPGISPMSGSVKMGGDTLKDAYYFTISYYILEPISVTTSFYSLAEIKENADKVPSIQSRLNGVIVSNSTELSESDFSYSDTFIQLNGTTASKVGCKTTGFIDIHDKLIYGNRLLKYNLVGNYEMLLVALYNQSGSLLSPISVGDVISFGNKEGVINLGGVLYQDVYYARFCHYFPDQPNWYVKFDTITEGKLYDKATHTDNLTKWIAMGDSITQGFYSVDSETTLIDAKKAYCAYIASINNWRLDNQGVGGTGWVKIGTPGDKNAQDLAKELSFTDVDIVTLAFGVNDWKGSIPFGSMSDTVIDDNTNTSVIPAMRYVIETIQNKSPLTKIFVITPINCMIAGSKENNWGLGYQFNGKTLEDMFNVIVEVCEYYGIEYIDMTHKSIFNRENLPYLLYDYVHPSEPAHKIMGRELAKMINFM